MKLAIVNVFFALAALAHASPERRGSFDYATHLGNLSPYQKAPVPSGISETLPADCTVDQVMLVSTSHIHAPNNLFTRGGMLWGGHRVLHARVRAGDIHTYTLSTCRENGRHGR